MFQSEFSIIKLRILLQAQTVIGLLAYNHTRPFTGLDRYIGILDQLRRRWDG